MAKKKTENEEELKGAEEQPKAEAKPKKKASTTAKSKAKPESKAKTSTKKASTKKADEKPVAEPVAEGRKLTRKEKIAAGLEKPFKGSNRKAVRAEERKELKKSQYYAKLRNYPTSPRKMRLVADLVRGKDVQHALAMLKLTPHHNAQPLAKLIRAAVDSYVQKSGGREDDALFVKTIMVDEGPRLKRLRPAPQGRAHRILKRSNHVTVYLGLREEEAA